MKYNIDLIIKPGKQNKFNINGEKKLKVCEDYGIKSNKNEYPMVVISDGCSSQEFSDWGARILSLELFNKLQNKTEISNSYIEIDEEFFRFLYSFAKYRTKILNLDFSILNATLSSLFLNNEIVQGNVLNDGYLIVGYKNGEIEINKFEYLQNAPYYLTYRFEPTIEQKYFKEFPDNKFIHIEMLTNKKDFKREKVYYKEFNIRIIFRKSIEIKNIDFILITTDGINTFSQIEDMDFIKELIDFKSLNGEFIQRRTNRIFQELEKENIYHADDITIAGISFIEEE